jgi:hypothetical protein
MNNANRNRRALILGGVFVVALLAWHFMSEDGTSEVVTVSAENIPAAEKRLERYRLLSATVPVKEAALASVQKELAEREKGVIQAETAAQAQAQLLQILRKIARAQPNPIDLRGTEMGPTRTMGDQYGEVSVALTFEAGIEQLVNFLADLTAQKELIGTTDFRVGSANPKQKTMPVRLTVSAVVRRELAQEKKGAGF